MLDGTKRRRLQKRDDAHKKDEKKEEAKVDGDEVGEEVGEKINPSALERLLQEMNLEEGKHGDKP